MENIDWPVVYILGLAPVFAIWFIYRIARTFKELNISDIVLCMVVGCMPIFRELVIIYIYSRVVIWRKK